VTWRTAFGSGPAIFTSTVCAGEGGEGRGANLEVRVVPIAAVMDPPGDEEHADSGEDTNVGQAGVAALPLDLASPWATWG